MRELNRGNINTGTGIVILIVLLMTVFSSMMIGNIVPHMKPTSDQTVIVVSVSPQAPKSNLQLYTFAGLTLTPSPKANIFPQPQERGGYNYGTPPSEGGSSAPSGGGGGGSGGGTAI